MVSAFNSKDGVLKTPGNVSACEPGRGRKD